MVSNDGGETWRIAHNTSSPTFNGPVSYANNVFFAALFDDSTLETIVFTSLDGGRSWHRASSTLSSRTAFPKPVNDHFIAVGARGLIQSSDDGQIFSTFDEGITDYLQELLIHPPSYTLNGDSFFIQYKDRETADEKIRASKDGVEWKVIGSKGGAPSNILYIEDINAWVGLGFGYNLSTSTDLANWENLNRLPLSCANPPFPCRPPYGVDWSLISFAYQNGVWLAILNVVNYNPTPPQKSHILFRAVGTIPVEWNVAQSADYLANEVIAGNGKFLLEDESGLYQSKDGQTWSPVKLSAAHNGPILQGRIFAFSGYFLFLQDNQQNLYISKDLENWKVFTFGDPSSVLIKGVFLLQTNFVEETEKGQVAVSLSDGSVHIFNGSSWTLAFTLPNNAFVQSVQLGHNGVYVAVNPASGEIYYSKSI